MIQDLLAQLHTFVSGLEPWQQVLALVPVGAIPFIESYLGSFLGTALGIHPLLAMSAAVAGNLVATFLTVTLAGRTREVFARRRGGRPDATPSRFRAKIAAAMDKYGVPGVCLLGPFVVASQISGPALVALGASRGRVHLWMTVSIIVWGAVFGLFGHLFLAALI